MAPTFSCISWTTTSSNSLLTTIQITVLVRYGLSTPRHHPRGTHSHRLEILRFRWIRRGRVKWRSSPISLCSILFEIFCHLPRFLSFSILRIRIFFYTVFKSSSFSQFMPIHNGLYSHSSQSIADLDTIPCLKLGFHYAIAYTFMQMKWSIEVIWMINLGTPSETVGISLL